MAWEGLNRRKFLRAKFPCLLKIIRDNEPMETILTHTENISVGGVCVIIKRHMNIFSSVHVELDLLDDSDVITCRGKIVWTVRRKATEEFKPSFYDTGIEFIGLGEDAYTRITATVNHLVKAGQAANYR